jgi:DNA-binding transcriptional ArsR family regulator
VGQIAEVSTLARSTVSHHLKILREAQVLRSEKIGKEVWFQVNKPFLEAVFGDVTAYLQQRL